MKISTLPDGTRGFDANRQVTAADADLLRRKGYQFAVRYIRRTQSHNYDLTKCEKDDLLGAGLGLMIVQHVALENWTPTPQLGTTYGNTAVIALGECDIPAEATCWLDLEGVKPGTPHKDVIDFCNNWWDVVDAIGYTPGLYGGFHAGLTPDELYYKLKFQLYWSAFTNNADDTVTKRGFCMFQHAAKPSDLIPGFTNQNFDVDTIRADALGGTPAILLL